jgi:putative SOS response-associated peptidase YedK
LIPKPRFEELRALLKPFPGELIERYAVSRAVNSARNDSEECHEPVTLDESEANAA